MEMGMIIFATNNQHKVNEVRSVLGKNFNIITLKEAGIDIDIPEPHDTLEANATEKSKTIFTLTNKNDAIATSIKDSLIKTPNGISGIFFKVGGNAATAKQFFLTDSIHNFIRGALYFDVTPNADSLKPVQDFLQADMDHIINTFKWKNSQ